MLRRCGREHNRTDLGATGCLRAAAQAARVAPVVVTSSTRTRGRGHRAGGRTRGGDGEALAAGRPTWRRVVAPRRQVGSGQVERASELVRDQLGRVESAQAARSGSAGTGTSVPASELGGASARSARPRAASAGQQPPELERAR